MNKSNENFPQVGKAADCLNPKVRICGEVLRIRLRLRKINAIHITYPKSDCWLLTQTFLATTIQSHGLGLPNHLGGFRNSVFHPYSIF